MKNIGYLGEGQLSRNMLWNMTEIVPTDHCIKDLIKLFHNSTHDKSHSFVSVMQHDDHRSQYEEKIILYLRLYHECYKAQTFSTLISTAKCNLVNLSVNNGFTLDRWKRGLSLMLKKTIGNLTIKKLRTLLLLEACFNALHKINFSGRIMPS